MAGRQMCAHLDGRASTCPAPRSGCFKGVGRVPERRWPWKRARLWAPSEPGAPGPRLPSPRVPSLPPPRPLGLPAQMASGPQAGAGGGEAGGSSCTPRADPAGWQGRLPWALGGPAAWPVPPHPAGRGAHPETPCHRLAGVVASSGRLSGATSSHRGSWCQAPCRALPQQPGGASPQGADRDGLRGEGLPEATRSRLPPTGA